MPSLLPARLRCPALLALGAVWMLLGGAIRAEEGEAEDTPRLRRLFERADTDNDGLISREELGRPRLFERLDRDGDGVLTWDEIGGRGVAPLGSTVRVQRDLSYATRPGADPARTTLDIYSPRDASGPGPVLVMVHGGAWRIGDKRSSGVWEEKARHWVAQGFVLVCVNYRLSPAVRHPGHVEDVAAALAWVHEHVGEFGGDPERLFLMGHSAGAHLAALVATDARRLEAVGKSPAILRGVVLLDSAALDPEQATRPVTSKMYEQAFGPRETWGDASPLRHVKQDPRTPAFLVINAEREESRAACERFALALRANKIRAERFEATGRDHGSLNRLLGTQDDPATAAVERFFASLSR